MKKLTEKILDEEREKYFPRLPAKYDAGMDDECFIDAKVIVFPGYPEWAKKKGKITLYNGSKSTGWVMQDYISQMIGLAHHLIENDYPQEAILAILPKDFSLKLAKRLNK